MFEQDDFLDCFGDPAVTGKIGTDIEDNKCSWLIVQALSRASDDQRASLLVKFHVNAKYLFYSTITGTKHNVAERHNTSRFEVSSTSVKMANS
jgi:geranylgeranyl pyrophosphate synthase